MMSMRARLSGLLPAAAGPGLQPRGDVFRLVADGGADFDVFGPLPQEPPPPDGSHREARDARHVVLVQQGFENTVHRCHVAPFWFPRLSWLSPGTMPGQLDRKTRSEER